MPYATIGHWQVKTVKLSNLSPTPWLAAAAVVGLAIGVAGCGNGGSSPGAGNTTFDPGFSTTTPDPNMIQVGLVASQNGDLRPWGVDSVNGALLAVKEFNDAGGLNGKKVQLLIGDSASKPEQGKTAAEKLMSDGVIGLVGEVASGITAQIALAAKDKSIPVVAVGATRNDITTLAEHVFRVCYTDALQGPVMAKFAYDDLGLRKVAIMTDKKQPYSTGLSDSFRAYYEKLGGTIVSEQFYETGQTQFGGQLTELKSKNPDGLFLSGYFNEVGPIVRQAVDAGLNAKFLGGDGWDSSEILTSGGDAILGGYFCNHYNSQEDRPEVRDFLSRWKSAFGGVPGTTMGALAYDAAKLVCDALTRATEPTSAGLAAALEDTVDFSGVSGKITLKGNNGDPPKRALVVKLTKEGQVFEKAYEPDELK